MWFESSFQVPHRMESAVWGIVGVQVKNLVMEKSAMSPFARPIWEGAWIHGFGAGYKKEPKRKKRAP